MVLTSSVFGRVVVGVRGPDDLGRVVHETACGQRGDTSFGSRLRHPLQVSWKTPEQSGKVKKGWCVVDVDVPVPVCVYACHVYAI